jgi:ABC-type multidrug transport system ATPase subunit
MNIESCHTAPKLSKYYGKEGEIKALDELDLEVYEGETFGLLGPNDAGKTTTIRLLNCIIKPTKKNWKITVDAMSP